MGRKRIGLLALVPLAGFVGLGSLWVVDRARRWETPRLESGWFTVLRDLPTSSQAGDGSRLVAVHLRCPHCLESLRRLQSTAARDGGAEALVVLLVDHDRVPS